MSSAPSPQLDPLAGMPLAGMKKLRKQYLSLYPIYLITLPPSNELAQIENQDYLIMNLLGEEKQPEDGYRKKFWRKVLDGLEDGLREVGDEDLEIDERFYDLLTELMVSLTSSAGPSSAPKTSYRTFIYDIPTNHPLTSRSSPQDGKSEEKKIVLLEEQIAIQGGTTGLRTWTAALHLAHHIIHHPLSIFPNTQQVVDNDIIELGAGTGFLSILFSQLGLNVISTDLGIESESSQNDQKSLDEEKKEYDIGQDGLGGTVTPLGRLKVNVDLNPPSSTKIDVRALDWTDASSPVTQRPKVWTDLTMQRRTIIAADVIYDPDLVPPLVDAINVLVGDEVEQKQAIISATVRNQETFDKFIETCKKQNLQVEFLEIPPMAEENPTFWDSALDKGTEVKIMRIARMV